MLKEEKYGIYQKNYNITFIMIDIFKNDKIISSECVGWYFGEPNEELNNHFTNKLKSTFE